MFNKGNPMSEHLHICYGYDKCNKLANLELGLKKQSLLETTIELQGDSKRHD